MADTSYQIASGKRVYAGRQQFPHAAVLDLIAAAAANSWVRLETNTFPSIWPETYLRPRYQGIPGYSYDRVLDAWASFAWDSTRHRAVIWGGGHANHTGNELYIWDAKTRLWSLAYYGTETVSTAYNEGTATWTNGTTMDGAFNSPMSSHTYDNQTYCEGLDRFLTWGGAAQHLGGPFLLFEETGYRPSIRKIAGYFCDLSLAGQGYVGGLTGSNPHWSGMTQVDLPGAKAWEAIDYHSDPTMSGLFGTGNISNGKGDSRVINGVQIVWQTTGPGYLRRIEMPSTDWTTHTITYIGSGSSVEIDFGAGCYCDHNDSFVITNRREEFLTYWPDVSTRTTASNPTRLEIGAFTGPGLAELTAFRNAGLDFKFGLDYDRVRGRLLAWNSGTRVFAFTPPDPLAATGWDVEVISAEDVAGGPSMYIDYGTFADICGKWKYAPDLDVCIGIQNGNVGEVWAFKPTAWVDPRND